MSARMNSCARTRCRLRGSSAFDAAAPKSSFMKAMRSRMKPSGRWSPMMDVTTLAAGRNIVVSLYQLNAAARPFWSPG